MLKSWRTNVIGIRDAACERAIAALVKCWRTSSPKRGIAMSKIAFLLTLFGAVIVCLVPAAPAQAQENRTFVSSTGNDSNFCLNAAAPCLVRAMPGPRLAWPAPCLVVEGIN